MDTEIKDDTAFEAHMEVVAHLKCWLERDPSAIEVACVLAKAYGDALAIAGSATNSATLVDEINAQANKAYLETLEAVGGKHCGILQ